MSFFIVLATAEAFNIYYLVKDELKDEPDEKDWKDVTEKIYTPTLLLTAATGLTLSAVFLLFNMKKYFDK